MACALSLFCWHWLSFSWLGSKQHNGYYATSSNDIKLRDLEQCFLVGFLLWYVCVIYNVLSHNIPSRVWDIETFAHMFLLLLIFSSQSKQRKNVLCLFLCFIVKSSLVILHRLVQLCFMWVILVSGESCK